MMTLVDCGLRALHRLEVAFDLPATGARTKPAVCAFATTFNS